MALTEQTVIDKIEVLEDGTLQVRTATRVLRDGARIAETYNREALTPGQSLTGRPANVTAIATAVWTPAVVAAHAAKVAAQGPPPNPPGGRP